MTGGVWGVVVTYRRPEALGRTLAALLGQDLDFERIVVVDDDPCATARSTVEALASPAFEYVVRDVSGGPAGARATGIERALTEAGPGDWIAMFDDDDPIPAHDVVSEVRRFADERLVEDPRVGGVGVHGGRLDTRVGRTRSVTVFAPPDVVAVDYLSGGWYSMYRAEALRAAGSFYAPLFFGWEELELGLRLRRAGRRLYLSGRLFRRLAPLRAAPPDRRRPSVGLDEVDLRRYYDLRNMTYILRSYDHPVAMASLAVTVGVLKPALGLVTAPRRALTHLRLGARAISDGMHGRLGPAPPDLLPAMGEARR